jgi:hypothetical protein
MATLKENSMNTVRDLKRIILNPFILTIAAGGFIAIATLAANVAADDCPDQMYWCSYPGQPNNGQCCNDGQSCCYDTGNQTVWCSSNGCGN